MKLERCLVDAEVRFGLALGLLGLLLGLELGLVGSGLRVRVKVMICHPDLCWPNGFWSKCLMSSNQ